MACAEQGLIVISHGASTSHTSDVRTKGRSSAAEISGYGVTGAELIPNLKLHLTFDDHAWTDHWVWDFFQACTDI